MEDGSRESRRVRKCWRRRRMERIDDCSRNSDWWIVELWILLHGLLIIVTVVVVIVVIEEADSSSLSERRVARQSTMKMIAAAVSFGL